MTEYTTTHKLFVQLNVHNNPMKYWFDGACWEMANCMCKQVLKKTQSVVVGGKFVFLSANEATTIDNQFQILVHVCVM
jgi:hypothetical protein